MTIEEKIKAFPTIIYSRVVGWMTPTQNFNKGKIAEYNDRKVYKINKSKLKKDE